MLLQLTTSALSRIALEESTRRVSKVLIMMTVFGKGQMKWIEKIYETLDRIEEAKGKLNYNQITQTPDLNNIHPN